MNVLVKLMKSKYLTVEYEGKLSHKIFIKTYCRLLDMHLKIVRLKYGLDWTKDDTFNQLMSYMYNYGGEYAQQRTDELYNTLFGKSYLEVTTK